MSLAPEQIPLSNVDCRYCELPFTELRHSLKTGRKPTIDHFIPESKGGKNIHENLFIVCQYCNGLKADMLPEQFLYFLHTRISLNQDCIVGGKTKRHPTFTGIVYNNQILKIVHKNVNEIYKGSNRGCMNKSIAAILRKRRKNTKDVLLERRGLGGVYYIIYNGVQCECVGFVDRAISNKIGQYQHVYYHMKEKKYIFVVDRDFVIYDKDTIQELIKPFFPGSQKHKIVFDESITETWIKSVK